MGQILSKKKKGKDAQQKALDDFISHLVRQKPIRCRYIPEFIERDIYENILRLMLHNLSEILQSIRIEFLHHEITIHIGPVSCPTTHCP